MLMYMLFAKEPPFKGATLDDIFKKIESGKYMLQGYPWQMLSESAKELIAKMLQIDPEKRISATEALEHEWLVKEAIPGIVDSKSEDLKAAVEHLINGKKHIILARAALCYMDSILLSGEQQQKFNSIFRKLDQDGDGYLNAGDLRKFLLNCKELI